MPQLAPLNWIFLFILFWGSLMFIFIFMWWWSSKDYFFVLSGNKFVKTSIWLW